MLSILVFVVSLMCEEQLLGKFLREKIIHQRQKKIFLAIFLLFAVLCLFFFWQKPFFTWLALFLINLVTLFLPVFIQRTRKREFQTESLRIVDTLVSSIKSGRSFRDTIKEMQTNRQKISYYFIEIFQAMSLDQAPERISNDVQVQRVYCELSQILKSQHRTAEKLVSLRRILKTECWFQQKTKQVLIQSRAQSLIMSILYLVLLAYILVTQQAAGNLDFVLLSMVMYTAGGIWIWRMGRRFQWKV